MSYNTPQPLHTLLHIIIAVSSNAHMPLTIFTHPYILSLLCHITHHNHFHTLLHITITVSYNAPPLIIFTHPYILSLHYTPLIIIMISVLYNAPPLHIIIAVSYIIMHPLTVFTTSYILLYINIFTTHAIFAIALLQLQLPGGAYRSYHLTLSLHCFIVTCLITELQKFII